MVGRLLDDDPVAGFEQVVEQHPARLQRAVGDHHLAGLEPAMAFGDPLTEGRVADPGAVGECPFPVLGEQRQLAARTASRGRMSALGAPRAKEIVSAAIAAEPSNASTAAARQTCR